MAPDRRRIPAPFSPQGEVVCLAGRSRHPSSDAAWWDAPEGSVAETIAMASQARADEVAGERAYLGAEY